VQVYRFFSENATLWDLVLLEIPLCPRQGGAASPLEGEKMHFLLVKFLLLAEISPPVRGSARRARG